MLQVPSSLLQNQMDDFVQEKLVEWGLEKYAENFIGKSLGEDYKFLHYRNLITATCKLAMFPYNDCSCTKRLHTLPKINGTMFVHVAS